MNSLDSRGRSPISTSQHASAGPLWVSGPVGWSVVILHGYRLLPAGGRKRQALGTDTFTLRTAWVLVPCGRLGEYATESRLPPEVQVRRRR